MTSAAAPFIVAASGWAPPMPPSPADTNTRPSRLPPNFRPATDASVSNVPCRMPWVPM